MCIRDRYNCEVEIYDPWVTAEDAKHEYSITSIKVPEVGKYDAILLAVAHQQFKDLGAPAIRALGKPTAVLYDLKYVLSPQESDLRL